MMPAERLSKILECINTNGSANIEELTKLVDVSESTIRRDLKKLADKGLIIRTHGGAVTKTISTTFEQEARNKRFLQKEEKEYIGQLAANYVSDGESILLDSGTTTLALSRFLKYKKGLTVITYDLRIALETELTSDSLLVVTGGIRRDGFDVLVGSETENFIRNLSVDKAFLGADAIDLEMGVTNAGFAEVSIKQEIIKSAKEVILVADYTKFGKTALIKVASLEDIDHIITDSRVDRDYIQRIERLGVWIEIADVKS